MQITLIETEIKDALKFYLQNNIGLSKDKNIRVDFTATRGSEGLKASIDVVSGSVPEAVKINPFEGTPKSIDQETGEIVEVSAEAPSKKSLFANLTA